MLAQVSHRLVDLLLRLAEPNHEPALRQPVRVEFLGVPEHLERTLELRLRPDGRVEARDRLDVVVERVGRGIYDGHYRGAVPLEVGGEDLDGAAGDLIPDLPDHGGEDRGAAVGELVAVDARDDGVLEAHLLRGVGDAVGLVEVELCRLAGQNGAEAAGTGTDVAEDHERRRLVVPALPDVRAAGLLADRVQVEPAHGLLDVPIDLAVGNLRLEPVRAAVQAGGAPDLLPEGQVLRRRAVRRRRDGPVFPAVAHLEGLRAVLKDLDVDLSAGHGSLFRVLDSP